MTATLFSLTARQLLGRWRTLLIGLAMLLPVVVAVVRRVAVATGQTSVSSEEFALGMVDGLVLTLLLPVVALVLGTAALGSEVEDGTAVFLLTTPVSRARIVVVKAVAAAAVALVLVVPATVAATWVVTGSPTEGGLVGGLGLAAAVATVLYCALFVALSAWTGRALVVGLVYVFVWEGLITGLFDNLRWISVREYAEGWAGLVVTADGFDPGLTGPQAVVAGLVALGLALVLGSRALERFEIGERGA